VLGFCGPPAFDERPEFTFDGGDDGDFRHSRLSE
jgi:hypothetical protein